MYQSGFFFVLIKKSSNNRITKFYRNFTWIFQINYYTTTMFIHSDHFFIGHVLSSLCWRLCLTFTLLLKVDQMPDVYHWLFVLNFLNSPVPKTNRRSREKDLQKCQLFSKQATDLDDLHCVSLNRKIDSRKHDDSPLIGLIYSEEYSVPKYQCVLLWILIWNLNYKLVHNRFTFIYKV